MTYSELLSQYVKESGLTLRKIANEAEKQGVAVDPSYISKLQTGKMPPPSEEITVAIAEACGKDPEKLVIQGYIDKTPPHVRKLLDKQLAKWDELFEFFYIRMIRDLDNPPTKDEFKNIFFSHSIEDSIDSILRHYQNSLYNMLENNSSKPVLTDEGVKIVNEETKKPLLRVPVYDIVNNEFTQTKYRWLSANDAPFGNYFYIIAPPGSNYVIPNSYLLVKDSQDDPTKESLNNGDIVLFNNNEELCVAKYFKQNNTVILQVSENEAPVIPEDLGQIWGKITKVEYYPSKEKGTD